MKIAFVTDDGQTVSAHFGRARHYLVYTIENNTASGPERRPRPDVHSAGREHRSEGHGHGGQDAGQRHAALIDPIADCQVLIARGMGQGARGHLLAAGIRPILTDIASVTGALQAYLEGRLIDHIERVH